MPAIARNPCAIATACVCSWKRLKPSPPHGDLTALFRDLARRLPTILPFEVIALFLHDPEKRVMRLHMIGTAEADRLPPGTELDIDQSFSGEVFKTQRPLVVSSPEGATRYSKSQQFVQDIGVQSFCILPLTTIVRPLGAIGFGSLRPHAFGDEELDFLGLVARQAAVAVDNVLHDESDRAAQASLSGRRHPAGFRVADHQSPAGLSWHARR